MVRKPPYLQSEHAVELGERFDNSRPTYQPNDPSMKGGIIECVW